MLNMFYWYSVIWSAVLVLYELKFSIYNIELDDSLLLFLCLSICISFIFGYRFRNIMKYPSNYVHVKHNFYGTVFICVVSFFTFLYAGHIPLISILLGLRAYGDFEVLPLLQPILINYIIYRTSKLYFIYLETKERKILIELFIILIVLILMFFKGTFIFCFFSMLNLYIAKCCTKKIINYQIILKVFLLCMIVIYINGGLANLRTGYSWDDFNFIKSLGGIDEKRWPTFLPGQFCWAYVYITSPLANLNLCVESYKYVFDFKEMIVSTIPLFISKRLFASSLYLFDMESFYLYHEALNACTGFVNSVVASGIYGIYFMYIILMLYMLITLIFIIKFKRKDNAYYYSIMSVVVAFIFFYNTLIAAATSLLIFIVNLSVIKDRLRIF